MRHVVRASFLTVALSLTLALTALAQPVATAPDRPGSLAFIGGLSAGGGDAGGSVGGVAAFDVTRRVAVEARGVYMERGPGSQGLELTGTMLFTVARSARAAPFVGIGGGVYRQTFDLGDDRFFGRMPFDQRMSMVPLRGSSQFGMMGPAPYNGPMHAGSWTGPTWQTDMPMFYANRMGQMAVPMDGRWMHRSFTDPALTVGGGVRLDLTGHLYVRPDVRALVVFASGERQTLATMTIGFGYRF